MQQEPRTSQLRFWGTGAGPGGGGGRKRPEQGQGSRERPPKKVGAKAGRARACRIHLRAEQVATAPTDFQFLCFRSWDAGLGEFVLWAGGEKGEEVSSSRSSPQTPPARPGPYSGCLFFKPHLVLRAAKLLRVTHEALGSTDVLF